MVLQELTYATSNPNNRKAASTANSSSCPKHLTNGPYGSSGCSLLRRLWYKGSVVAELEGSESISVMATRTAWTVSTRCSFRRRLT